MSPEWRRPPTTCTSKTYLLSIDAMALHSMLIVPMSSVARRSRPYSSCSISPVTWSPFLSVMTSVLSRSAACAEGALSSMGAASSALSSTIRLAFIVFLRRDRGPTRYELVPSIWGCARAYRSLSVNQRDLLGDAQVLNRVELTLDLEEPRH